MNQQKERHGCLIAYLAVVIGVGVALSLLNLLELAIYHQVIAPDQRWLYVAAGLAAAGTVACGLALFRWKRWGFYGLILLAVVNTVLSMIVYGYRLGYVVAALAQLVALCVALQAGGDRDGWGQLE